MSASENVVELYFKQLNIWPLPNEGFDFEMPGILYVSRKATLDKVRKKIKNALNSFC